MGGTMGSGKTTVTELLENLLQSAKNVCVETFTTDDFFIESDGTYRFQGSQIQEAHAWNEARVEDAMLKSPVDHGDKEFHLIIVHNTFGESWEAEKFQPYAETHGFFLINTMCRTLHNGVSEHVSDMDIVDGCSEKIALSFAPWLKPVKTRPRNKVTSLI